MPDGHPHDVIDVFLDRDGVIIRNRPDYVKSWSEVEILPGAIQAIGLLCRHGCRVAVVTNQSVIGRGIVSRPAVDEIHRRLGELIRASGGTIAGYFICPHRPDEGCACRKPKPGLLTQAAEVLGLTLQGAVLVGDQLDDLEAAASAGCSAILVDSGVYVGTHVVVAPPHRRARDLMGAAMLIVNEESS
jgi:D-glycero-D-manno-heptose 1,7-bisphosphate phosphatase